MYNKVQNEVKGRGFMRKTNLGLLCGIALAGAMVFGGQSVSADEVSTQPSTETTVSPDTKPTQPSTPTDVKPTVDTPKATEGNKVVVSGDLDKVVEKGKELGITIKEEPAVDLGSATSNTQLDELKKKAEADVKTQEDKLTKELNAYKEKVDNSRDELYKVEKEVPATVGWGFQTLAQLSTTSIYDTEKGLLKLENITSSKGLVSYLKPGNSDSVNFDSKDSISKFVMGLTPSSSASTVSAVGDNAFERNKIISDKAEVSNLVPIEVSEGETLTYDVSVAKDAALAKLGISKVRKTFTLTKSPYNENGIFVNMVTPRLDFKALFLGGNKEGTNTTSVKQEDWSFATTLDFLDSSGTRIPMKELAARVYNTYAFDGKQIIDSTHFISSKDSGYFLPTQDGSIFNELPASEKFSVLDSINTDSHHYELKVKLDKNIPKQGVSQEWHYKVASSNNLIAPVYVPNNLVPQKPELSYHKVSYTDNRNADFDPNNLAAPKVKGSVVQKFVNEQGTEIAKSTSTGEKPEGEALTLSHPNEISNGGKTYIFVSQDKPDPKKIVKGETVITYVYKEKEAVKGSVTQKFVDDKGKEIANVIKTGDKPEGSDLNLTHPKEITFQGKTYIFVSQDKPDPKKITKGETIVTYTYKEKEQPKPEVKGSVVQKFVDTKGIEIKERTNTGEQKEGSSVSLSHPMEITFQGKTYTFVSQDKPDPSKVVKGEVVVTYTYTYKEKEQPKPAPKPETPNPEAPKPTPTVEPTTIFVDEDGKEVAPKEKGTQPPKTVEGYTYNPQHPKNKEDKNGETVRVYKKIQKGGVVQHFVNEEGSKIAESISTLNLEVGSKLELKRPTEITSEGKTYVFVKQDKETPTEISEGIVEVTYTYKLKETPTPTPTPTVDSTTIFVDEDGKEVAPKEKGTQPPKAIEGYEYDSTNPKNKEDKDGETVRVYKKVKYGTVVQRFVDEQGKELQPSVNSGRLKLGSKLELTFPKKLTINKDKYTFKSQDKETPKEVTSEGELVITYVYAKEVAPVVPTTPTETPSKPSTIVPEAKPSVSRPNGVVAPTTESVAKSTLPNTGSGETLSAAIAGLGLLTLVGLSGRRTKED